MFQWEGKMTNGNDKKADLCFTLRRANWLVHIYPDKRTRRSAGERNKQTRDECARGHEGEETWQDKRILDELLKHLQGYLNDWLT